VAAAGKDACNATFKAHIKTSPHQAMYGEPTDSSRNKKFQDGTAATRNYNSGYAHRLEYKEDHGEFIKYKARLCLRGDQQINGVNFKETDL
jgi:hypothetical protein